MKQSGMLLALLLALCLLQASSRLEPSSVSKPGLGSAIADQYIVVFKGEAGDATAAADALVLQVQSAMSQEAGLTPAQPQEAAAAAFPRIRIVRRLGARRSSMPCTASATTSAASVSQRSSSYATTSAAAPAATPATGMQAVVVSAPSSAVKHIQGSRLVASVFPDRVIAAQAVTSCIDTPTLGQGVSATPAATFKWPKCLTVNTKLLWLGEKCSTTGKIAYNQIIAVDKRTGATAKVGTTSNPCILYAKPDNAAWTRQRFGGCGVAPAFARDLPMKLCTAPTTPPAQGSPRSAPASLMPRTLLKSGDSAPAGISRIEAATTEGSNTMVFNTGNLPAQQQVVVAVLDSGVDATHPDLNFVGGSSWAMTSLNVANDVVDANVDLYGHGTHVAGVIGARNNGAGVAGVAPGVGIYSLKVLDAEGRGTLSAAMDAVAWAISPEGQAKGIKVINLSLAGYVSPGSADYAATMGSVCAVFKEASDAGVVVVAAAGNYGVSMAGYMPASCPTVAAVTSLDVRNNIPSSFSNWLPADAQAADKARVIAAPGGSVISTISFAKDPSGYRQLSGTSMASPHVAAVAATCIMSGACRAGSTGVEKLAVIQAAARERVGLAGAPAYGFTGDATSSGTKYYGYLTWAKF